MATSAERMRALRKRERERRGLRRFTIRVSEDDLRVIAKHGYEGVLSPDPDQQARALRRAAVLDAGSKHSIGFRRDRRTAVSLSHRSSCSS
jgi:hypothetical protein